MYSEYYILILFFSLGALIALLILWSIFTDKKNEHNKKTTYQREAYRNFHEEDISWKRENEKYRKMEEKRLLQMQAGDDAVKYEEKIQTILEYSDFARVENIAYEFFEKWQEDIYVAEVHFFILSVINMAYKYRDQDPGVLFLVLGLCDYDMNRYDALIHELGDNRFRMVTPTRKAIILEKMGRLEEAIEVCNWAIERSLTDSPLTFEKRKENLENRLKRKIPTRVREDQKLNNT